jgi:hypothetical protein
MPKLIEISYFNWLADNWEVLHHCVLGGSTFNYKLIAKKYLKAWYKMRPTNLEYCLPKTVENFNENKTENWIVISFPFFKLF